MPLLSSPSLPPYLQDMGLTNRRTLVGMLGLSLCIGGLLSCIYAEAIFDVLMAKMLELRPNSMVYDIWKNPPVAVNLDFYLFNWTNPQDFHNHSIKPRFQEMGPYSFTEKPDKVDIKWHPENASVSYRKQSYFYFDAAQSKGSLDDETVALNTLAVITSSLTRYWGPAYWFMVNMALRMFQKEKIDTHEKVGKLLFDGADDDLVKFGNIFPSLNKITETYDRFGYSYPLNGSSTVSGVFNVNTGAKDIRKLGQVNTWNYKNTVEQYYPTGCANVSGSGGELQTGHLKKTDSIRYFVREFCRTLTLDYIEEVEVEGIIGYKYGGGLRLMDNGSVYPENECFCNGECSPSGVMNISSCWFGIPLFMSYPHFYLADPFYLEQVEGLHPNKDEHELYIVIEPRSGLTLNVMARLQVNELLTPNPHINLMRKQRKIYFPIFWFNLRTRISPELAGIWKLFTKLQLSWQVGSGLTALIGTIIFLRFSWQTTMKLLNRRFEKSIKINYIEKELALASKKSVLQTSPETISFLEKTITADIPR